MKGKRKKQILFAFKLNPENEWDKEILNWLKSIPSGNRSAMIKYFLWKAITGKDLPGLQREKRTEAEEAPQPSPKVSKRLDEMTF